MPKEFEFLTPGEPRGQTPERVYLPPLLFRDPFPLSLAYPRTVLNNLLHEKRLTLLQAMIIEDDVFEQYQDHYDTDAVHEGRIPDQAMSDISRRVVKRELGPKVIHKKIHAHDAHKVEGDMKKILGKGQSIIVGDTKKAVLLAGSVRDHQVPMISPFPKPGESPESQTLYLPELAEIIARGNGKAWFLPKQTNRGKGRG